MLDRNRSQKTVRTLVLFSVLLVSLAALEAAANEAPLRVGVKEAPPFAMKGADGGWHGITVDLWRDIAADLGLEYAFQELALPELLSAIEAGRIDVGVGAITVTPERETKLDFSHPFYSSGVGVAARRKSSGWETVVLSLLSPNFLRALFALCAVLVAAGVAVWFFERRRNTEQFGGSAAQGIGSAVWWAAVTMTTVGYGDKAPITAAGRLVALVWMFVGVITISGFTAAIASSLTVSSLESEIKNADDLAKVRVGTVSDTAGAQLLVHKGIAFRPFGQVADALAELDAGSIDAVVHDQPLLIHEIKTARYENSAVVPWVLARQDYAFALPPGSSLREPLNRSLLRALNTSTWQEIRIRYLGASAGE